MNDQLSPSDNLVPEPIQGELFHGKYLEPTPDQMALSVQVSPNPTGDQLPDPTIRSPTEEEEADLLHSKVSNQRARAIHEYSIALVQKNFERLKQETP